jgi:Ca2+-binding RTX toxin-like protein
MPRKPPKNDSESSVVDLGVLASKKNFDSFIDHLYTEEENVPHFDFYSAKGKQAPVHVVGSDVSEDVILTDLDDVAEMGDGNDVVVGLYGNDTISGGDGGDYLFGDTDWAVGFGQNSNDILNGGADDDLIVGDAPNLYGDTVGGNDIVVGGTGNDDLWGDGSLFEEAQGGADSFVFEPDSGLDTIHDFEVGKDKLDISGYSIAETEFLTLDIQEIDGNTIIDLDGTALDSNEITLLGVVGVSADDFVFA